MPLDIEVLERRLHDVPPGSDITLPRNDVLALLHQLRETELFLHDLILRALQRREGA